MSSLREWFSVRFNDDAIDVQVNPPNGEAWEAQINWERIIRVCFEAGDWSRSDAIYIFTDERPESYLIPTEAGGGSALWAEILGRKLFDAGMAIEAAMAANQMFCSPLKRKGVAGENFPLYSPRQLPDIEGETISLTWDQIEADSIIRHEETIIWREWTGWEVYDRFEEIAVILKHKYGSRLVDLVPTPRSLYALYGDRTVAYFHVTSARESLGGDIATESFHWFRLEQAVREGDTATIKKYLAQGGDPNVLSVARGSSDTLLHMAGRHRRPDMARMLVAARANVNAMDALGRPPLVAALDTQFIDYRFTHNETRRNPETLLPGRTTELVRLLVFAGANLSGLNRPFSQVGGLKREMYRSPLTLAARHGYTDALRFLLEQGAAIEVEDHFGDTSLIEALRWGQAEAAKILIAAGADVNREPYTPDDAATTQLLLIIKSERFDAEQKVPLIRQMLEAGADANRVDAIGDSPLLTAVRFGTDHYYAIIGVGDQANNYTWQVLKWPVQKKASPAQIAPLIEVLRAGGANINIRDRDGKTAREIASEGGLTELVALL